MKPYGNQLNLNKKASYQTQKNQQKKSLVNIKLIHQIIDTINVSLLVLIFTLFFLSLDSQRKWSNTYKTLFKTKVMNNNLIDYISTTEEFYISELDSRNTYRKTKPKDLIYLDRTSEKKESFFKKNFRSIIKGISDSQYQRGY